MSQLTGSIVVARIANRLNDRDAKGLRTDFIALSKGTAKKVVEHMEGQSLLAGGQAEKHAPYLTGRYSICGCHLLVDTKLRQGEIKCLTYAVKED